MIRDPLQKSKGQGKCVRGRKDISLLECYLCHSTYTLEQNLRRHIRKEHVPDEKAYQNSQYFNRLYKMALRKRELHIKAQAIDNSDKKIGLGIMEIPVITHNEVSTQTEMLGEQAAMFFERKNDSVHISMCGHYFVMPMEQFDFIRHKMTARDIVKVYNESSMFAQDTFQEENTNGMEIVEFINGKFEIINGKENVESIDGKSENTNGKEIVELINGTFERQFPCLNRTSSLPYIGEDMVLRPRSYSDGTDVEVDTGSNLIAPQCQSEPEECRADKVLILSNELIVTPNNTTNITAIGANVEV